MNPRNLVNVLMAWRWAASTLAALLLVGACASPTYRAPVEDRKAPPKPASSTPAAPAAPASAAPVAEATAARPPAAGAENVGKPGYYTVKPGDTLIRIGLDNGQNWRDIGRWSGLENVNLIEVGQVLRVAPPVADPNAVTARPVAPAGRVDARPLDGRPPAAAASAAGSGAPVAPAAAPRDPDEEVVWAWPAAGPVATAFDDNKSKGLGIAGKAGDPVLAAADGRVVYAGSGLRGYGNLVIVKHNTTFLTAYAHNQILLVKEDQAVRRGQKIAEMGSSDADQVQLHFEIRRQGRPIDPARLLPPR
jgi:lipoprotein NlpD